MLDTLTHEQFEPCVNQTFQVTADHASPQDIELVEVKVIGDPVPGLAPRHSFSLLFHGPREALLPQAIYHFENETIGALDFVIVPLGPDQHHQRYEAIFN